MDRQIPQQPAPAPVPEPNEMNAAPSAPEAPLPPAPDAPLPPTSAAPMAPPPAPAPSRRLMGRGTRIRFMVIGAIILGIGLIIAAIAFWPQLAQRQGAATQEIVETIDDIEPIADPLFNAAENEAPVEQRDTDGDGLLDVDESQFGTDPEDNDTDDDGLTDRQEVRIYNTNPKRSDTDGDGFSDGEEVRSFYNPNGSGRLLNVEEAITEFNAENQ